MDDYVAKGVFHGAMYTVLEAVLFLEVDLSNIFNSSNCFAGNIWTKLTRQWKCHKNTHYFKSQSVITSCILGTMSG